MTRIPDADSEGIGDWIDDLTTEAEAETLRR